MDWKGIDHRLIRRGMLLLELGFVNNYRRELKRMNEGKLGRPFKLTDSYVKFVGVVRYLFSMGFSSRASRPLYTSWFPGFHPSTTLGSGGAC